MIEDFKSIHNLPFLVAPWINDLIIPEFNLQKFKIGTCTGLWGFDKKNYFILAIDNEEKGNGHLQDVFDWFENSCKRDHKNLIFLEVWNQKFKKHLIEKRGFVPFKEDAMKSFRAM